MTEELRLVVEVAGFILAIGAILWRLSVAITRFELIGSQQSEEITEIKLAIQKMEAIFSLVAVEKVRLDSQAERLNAFEKRIDERLGFIERRLEDLIHGRGFIKSKTDDK